MGATEPAQKQEGGRRSALSVFRSLRLRFELLLLVIAVPAVLIVIQLGLTERRQLVATAAERTRLITAQLQSAQARQIEDTRLFMQQLALAEAVQNPQSADCQAFLATLLPMVPQYRNLGVASADGDLACVALPGPEPVDVSDRAYFQRVLEQGSFSMSTFITDRVSQTQSVTFSYPVRSPGSEDVRNVAIALVALDWWSDTLAAETLPESTVAFITDASGLVVATYPKMSEMHGKPVSDFGFDVDDLIASRTEHSDIVDGVHRVYSHRALVPGKGVHGFAVSLGLPIDTGLAAAQNRLLVRLVVVVGVMVALWRVAVRIMERTVYRPFVALSDEIRQLESTREPGPAGQAGGKRALHSTVNEFDEISQSFRQMSRDRLRRMQMLDALIDALPDIYFRIGADGEVLDYRAQEEEDLYMAPEQFLGQRFDEIMPPDVGMTFEANRLRLLQGEQTVTWEYVLEIDGQPRDFEARICAIPHSEEAILVVRDTTQRRQAERNRQAAEDRLDQIVENLPGAVIQWVVEAGQLGDITYVSPQAQTLLGYSEAEIRADPKILDRAHDAQDLPGFLTLLTDALTQERPISHRHRMSTRNGEGKWIDFFCSAPRWRNDKLRVVEAFLLDVTREVEAQERYEMERIVAYRAQKNESIGQMTGGVAHDFNNLLAVILGNLELLQDDLNDPALMPLIEGSIRAVGRGADLTRNMLAFARKAPLEPKEIDLNRLVGEARSWIGRTLPASISVETRLSAGVWPIEADPGSTESALLNLIVNARDAMPTGGELIIQTENWQNDGATRSARQETLAPGRYVVLSVSDTGTGIPAEVLPQIFEPFYTTKAPGAGTGLGLSMVMGFMRQSGGEVQVSSQPGQGTVFKLIFRASNDEMRTEAPASPGQLRLHEGKRHRVLVAEDQPEVLSMLCTVLEKAGYEVLSARSGDEAKALFAKDTRGFDLLLTDIVMPGTLQGTQLSLELRALQPDLPVVFMSGYANEALAQDNALRPEDVRLMKPIARADLLAALRAVLKD